MRGHPRHVLHQALRLAKHLGIETLQEKTGARGPHDVRGVDVPGGSCEWLDRHLPFANRKPRGDGCERGGFVQRALHSTTRRIPSRSATAGLQSQVRCASAGSRLLCTMSPGRSGAKFGSRVYPVAAATSRYSSRSETCLPQLKFATTPEGPDAARTVASTTSPT